VAYKDGSDKDSMLAEGQRLVLTFYKNAEPMEVI
jgi:hypothetical protein